MPHNIADIDGGSHTIVFHRTPGPIDSDEERAIVISGNNSTIVNETEYTIILESGTSGNNITSCGPVIDNGNNTVTLTTGCFEEETCSHTTAMIEAECFDDISGVEIEESSEGTDNLGFIDNGDWVVYNNIDLTGMYSVNVRVATKKSGGSVEVRLDALDGELLATIPVTNTGDWQTYTTDQANLGLVDGTHDVYLVFIGADKSVLNINWFGFSEEFLCDGHASLIEVECFDEMSGIETEGCSEGTLNVGFIHSGDWLKYYDVDLINVNSFKARVASKNTGGDIEVRLDDENGLLLGTLSVANTGGWQSWTSDSVSLTEVSGVHDVVLLFTGGASGLFNINNFELYKSEWVVTNVNGFTKSSLSVFPNPTTGFVKFSRSTSYQVTDSFGQEILSGNGVSVD